MGGGGGGSDREEREQEEVDGEGGAVGRETGVAVERSSEVMEERSSSGRGFAEGGRGVERDMVCEMKDGDAVGAADVIVEEEAGAGGC